MTVECAKPLQNVAASRSTTGRKKPPKSPLNGPAVVQAWEAIPPPSEPPPAMQRIVQARKPGSKPYPSLNIPKAPPDPDADRKVKGVPQEDDAEPSHATG